MNNTANKPCLRTFGLTAIFAVIMALSTHAQIITNPVPAQSVSDSVQSGGNHTQKAQSPQTITGRIRDTSANKDCPLAVVTILTPDSTIVRFTRTRKDGSFTIGNLKTGTYRLLVTHPAFSEYTAPIILKDAPIDLGSISMSPRSDKLEAVVVTPKNIPPKLKGDTLEYTTTHIKTRVNANIEELLTRLPGVQVDANGTITVNGKKIQRLLVDGEDLFSGDPTIVTRNFNADMIAKVQVYERKSDQAQFTGIDDGQRTRTLNLTLKPDSKKGYFSKVEGGGDTEGYYNANALLGSFKGKRQFAALAMTSNTGQTGFSGNVGSFGSGLNLNSSTNDALNASAGSGIPTVMGAGAHFADRWAGKENHVSGNYQFGRLTTSPYSSSIVRQTLPDSIYTQRQDDRSTNIQEQHGLNADFDYNPDSLQAFHFSVGGLNMKGHNRLAANGSSAFNDTLVNSSRRTVSSDVTNQSFQGSVMWRVRGAKNRQRNLSVIMGMAKQDNTTSGFLGSVNDFFQKDGSPLRSDTTDQRKQIGTSALILNGALNYTQPLWKNAVLALAYGMSYNRSQSQQSTYNKGDGKYNDYVDSLSNHYQNTILGQHATVNLQVNDKTFSYTLGGDIRHDAYRQQDLLKDSVLKYNYLTLAPRINARYNITQYIGFSFDYNGSTQQPSITQLQPVQNNNDPLHITLGNPDLRQSFSHSFNLGWYSLNPLVMNLGLTYGFTTNGISTRTITDSLGRQVSQAVNTSGSNNGGLYFSINKKLKKLDLDLGFNSNVNYGRSVNYVNQYLSRNDNYNTGGGLNINKFVPEKYSIQLGSNINYSYSRSSINPQAATHYWTQSYNGNVSVWLPGGLELNNMVYYNWRQKIDNFDQHNSTLMWNAYLLKNFLANRLTVRWQINDILGQNAGISRSISTNQTTENTFNVLGRYWMLSVSYRFMNHRKAD